MKHSFIALTLVAVLATSGPAFPAAKGQATTMPDFTRGGLPNKARAGRNFVMV